MNSVENINITMGFPLKNLSFSNAMKKLFYLILLFCGIFLLNPDQFGSGNDKFAASNNEVVKEKEQQEIDKIMPFSWRQF